MGQKFLIKTILNLFLVLQTSICVPESYASWRLEADCFILKAENQRFKEFHIDKDLRVGSFQECRRECDLTFKNCKSFSYNENAENYDLNCFLSRKDTSVLDIGNRLDFDYDNDFNYYERARQSECDMESGEVRRIGEVRHKTRATECYKLVKTGIRIASRHIKKTLRTSDRAECEAECSRTRLFTCRSFNYRFRAYSSSLYMENCELSVQDTYGVDIDDKFNFYDDDDFDFYERTNFGKNCDGTQTSSSGREDNWYGSTYGSNYNNYYSPYDTSDRDDDDDFELFKKESRLDTRVVREGLRVRSLAECQEKCLRTKTYLCLTLAFSYDAAGYSTWYRKENCYLSDQKASNLDSYGIMPDRSFDLYERDDLKANYGTRVGFASGGYYDAYGREELYETVSGFQCYQNPCREDRIGKYFFCETDASGGWDYCCRPREHCQLSAGYPMKWCHVGSIGEDQWRPCNTASRTRAYLKKEEPDFLKLLESPSNVSTTTTPPSTSSSTSTAKSASTTTTTTTTSSPKFDQPIELADLPNLG